jgi:iron(III) transport system substrate-binding protein
MAYRREILIAVGVLVILALIAVYYTTLPRAPEATPTPLTPTPTPTYSPTPTPTSTQPTQTPTREELLKPIIDAARREGRLTIYSTLDRPSAEPLLKRFKELYPFIEVEYLEMGSSTVFSRFRSEVATGAPTADILWSPAFDLQLILINEGHALPYKLTFYDQIAKEAKFKDLAYTTSYTLYVPIFNKEKIPRELWPKSYGDILNLLTTRKDLFPKGSICAFDPIRSGFALVAEYYRYKTMEPYYTMTYTRVGEIGGQLHASTGPQIERVKTGECILSTGLIANYAFRDAKADPRLGAFIPEDYSHLIPRVMFITKHAKNPNAAKLFLEFVMSDEGQRILGSVGEVTLVENPYYPELSLPEIAKRSKTVIIAKLDDEITGEILKEDVRKSFQDYYKKLLGLG